MKTVVVREIGLEIVVAVEVEDDGRWRKRWAIPLSSDRFRLLLLLLLLGFGPCAAEEVVAIVVVVGRG